LQGGSGTQYFVGDFDGTTFSTSQKDTKWVDFGADNYAGVLYSNIPEEDGRHLFIGWMSNWAYANKVSLVNRKNMMTLPRSISLISTADDHILALQPVHEVRTVTSEGTPVSMEKLRSGFEIETAYMLKIAPEMGDSQLIFTNTLGDSLLVGLSQNEISIDRSRCGNVSLSKVFSRVHQVAVEHLEQVSIYMDRSSIELFANEGQVNMTDLFFTQAPLSKIFVSDDTNSIGVVYSPITLNPKPL
ncbi:MAG: GH32 C-terminal domain-containing protein, partial [Marinoscillum sp.]